VFRLHMQGMRHEDTTLWFWQALTGFALFFLASMHLYVMLAHPDRIGPWESADRVWSEHYWPLYIALLLAVEVHGGIGLYRLAVKWGWLGARDPATTRRRLKRLKWAITAFFLILGFATLAAYVKIGIEHADRAGERYVPAAAR
jgi:fumarate reductase subunit C